MSNENRLVFVKKFIADIQINLLYNSQNNFTENRLYGYTDDTSAMLKLETVKALKKVQDKLAGSHYSLLIYDAYHPQMTDELFTNRFAWERYYPFGKNEKHERYLEIKAKNRKGYTVDLTLIKAENIGQLSKPVNWKKQNIKYEKEIDYMEDGSVDMGCSFDTFDECSAHGYWGISDKQKENREILKSAMEKHGFTASPEVWWQYTLSNTHKKEQHNFGVQKEKNCRKSLYL
uniref:D-Ala-D-Ala dipeptidase n=1 Tax=Ditylenchus dipsaci TaxID=166011 RepID=A0A915DU24_9BILA